MVRSRTFQSLFRRHRRPGDIVFAWFVLVVSLALLAVLGQQTSTKTGARLFAQPWFWPALSLSGMSLFAALHLAGSALSQRIEGRWQEVALWLSALEYVVWFIAYAAAVPYLGYLPATVLFAVALARRAGYRSPMALGWSAAAAVVIVVLFRTLLQVALPAGLLYEALPDGLRQIMLTHF